MAPAREKKTQHMRSKQLLPRCLRAILASIFFPGVALAAEPPGMPDGWSDGYVYANGIRLHYYRAVPAPEKPVMVMVHGITDNGLCWTTLTLKLQDNYDIYLLDARGHGLSDPFTPADGGDTLIKDVVAAVDALGLKKPILMGHSMGAATVMRVGAEYPDLARSVIMLDPFLTRAGGERRPPRPASDERREPVRETAPKGEPRDTPREAPRNADPAGNRLSVSMAAAPERLVAQNNYKFEDLVATGRRQFPKWNDADIKYWALSKKQYHGAYSDAAWQAMSGAMQTGDALGRIPVPAIVLKADTSPDGRSSNEKAVEGLDRVKLVHIDGAGHNLHHDELERTVVELTKFLATPAPDGTR